MHVEELPLVLFTICAQMSVGAFVVLGMINVLGARHGRETVDRVTDPALYAIGPTLVFGLLASMLHLGNPVNALNSLRHLESSWLSREILFGVLFAGLGAAFAVSQWFKWFSPALRQALAVVTAVVGLALVWSMSQVYVLVTVPAWDSWATPVRFFTTTFLLGSLAVGLALALDAAFRSRRSAYPPAAASLMASTVRWITIGAMAMVAVEFVVLPVYLGQMATAEGAAAAASTSTLSASGLVIARILLVVLGVALLGFYLFKLARKAPPVRALVPVVAVAFVLVLAGETLGRTLFYASFERIGM